MRKSKEKRRLAILITAQTSLISDLRPGDLKHAYKVYLFVRFRLGYFDRQLSCFLLPVSFLKKVNEEVTKQTERIESLKKRSHLRFNP